MSETFLMSNMTPQRPSLNRRIWRQLEDQVRTLALPARRRPHQRIEHELEGPVRLHPVLRAESDEHHSSLNIAHRDDCGLLGDVLFTDQPPALHDVAINECDDARDLFVPGTGCDLVRVIPL